jgi:hypothetical protein
VADRFHLLCNLTSAVQRALEQKRTALAKAIVPVIVAVIPELSVPHAKSASQLTTRSEQVREDRRQCRMDRYNEVVGLYRTGMNQQEISDTLHMGRKTIRRFLRAGQFPERATPHRAAPGILKYQDFLNRRFAEGCHNATKLWHELQAQGYTGGRSTMARFVASFRTQEPSISEDGNSAPATSQASVPAASRNAAGPPARKTETG